MDMSKLPRLSQTESPPPDAPLDPAPEVASPSVQPDAAVGAEVWISAIIGIVFVMIAFNFAKYCIANLTGQTYHTGVNWVEGPKAGTEVAYPQLEGNPMLNDSAMFIFGVALLLEALVLAVAGTGLRMKRGLVGLACGIAALATAYNLIVAAKLFSGGVLPLMSLLAVAFGGYMAMYEWRLFQSLQPVRR